jgi:hypothetical protein
VAVQLDAIRQRDPAFDKTRFLSRAEAVLALVHRARAEGKPEQARAVVSDDMALRLRTELDGMRTAGRRQVHDGLRVKSADIVEATADDRFDTVAVRFSLEGASYEAGSDGKPVTGFSKDKRRWDEVWWFQRRAGATTTAADDGPLDRCPSCGAPLAATADNRCAYCSRELTSPTTWALTRIADSAPTPHAGYSAVSFETFEFEPVAKAARAVGLIITLVVLVTVVGGIGAAVIFATKTTNDVKNAFTTATDVSTVFTFPGGVTVPAGLIPGGTPTSPPSTGFVTPVANPKVRAPVNDLPAAAAAVQAKAGRPLMLSDIHLYPDGRIIFEVQALDDPKGADSFTWKGGTVTGPEQSIIGINDPSKLYPLAGLELSNLAKLCDAALGAVGIPDGVIESPYLLKIQRGLTWYIPVQSESRSSTRKTYWVAPDGSKPAVF